MMDDYDPVIIDNDDGTDYKINIEDDRTDDSPLIATNDDKKYINDKKKFIHRVGIVAAVIILFMYLPMMMGYECYECTEVVELTEVYHSTMLKMALICSCIICIPMLLYSLSNIYDRYYYQLIGENDNQMDESFTSTLLMILLLNVPDLYLLLIGIPYKQDDFIYASLQVRDTFFNLFFVLNSISIAPHTFTRRTFYTSFIPFAISNSIYNFVLIGTSEALTTIAIAISAFGLFDILLNTVVWFIKLRKIYGGYAQMFDKMSTVELKCSVNTLLFLIYNYAGWIVYWTCSFNLFLVIYTYIVVFISIVHIFVEQRASANISMKLRTEKAVSEIMVTKILPRESSQEFLSTGSILPRQHRNITIFFSDIENFTKMSANCSPIQIMSLLSRLYFNMDYLAKKFPTLFKVETIGDAVSSSSSHIIIIS